MQTIDDLHSYTVPALFANSVAKFPERPALSIVDHEPITYADLSERVNATRNILWNLGVRKGDKVAIFGISSPNWGIAYFSISTLGAIAVPLLPDFSQKEAETCLSHAEVKTLFVTKRLGEKIADPAKLGISSVISLDDFSVQRGSLATDGVAPEVEVLEGDIASIIYTSGTTGRSKGVMLTHKNIVFDAIGGQYFQRINKYDVALSILPMSHVYEFTIGFLMFMLNGAAVYYLEKPPTVTILLPAMLKVRPTLMLSVPLIMEKIYKNKIVPTFTSKPSVARLYAKPFWRKIFHRIAGLSLKKTFGGRMKFFGIGGAKVDPVVERFMKEAKFPYAIGYGLTETAPLLAGAGPKKTFVGGVGKFMPGVEAKLLDPDPTTGVGELVVKGPNVMLGYYRDPEMTASVFTQDGWFRTGDLGSLDAKGRLALKGRSKNMILNAAGENIYPEDIEFVINQHPFVVESLVVEGENSSLVAYVQLDSEKIEAESKKRQAEGGKPQSVQEMAGQQIQAMSSAVSGAVGGAVSAAGHIMQYKTEEMVNEIRFFVNDKVNRISRIDRVEFIEQFEKTASQKIKRYIYTIVKHAHHNS